MHKLGIEGNAYAHYTSLLCFALYEKLQSFLEVLLDLNVGVRLDWIPGRVGIQDNESVDKLAKEVSDDIFRGRNPATFSYTSAVKMSSDIARKSWHRKWRQEFRIGPTAITSYKCT